MTKFEAKTFNIPALKGMSAKSIEEHLKLYQGYVKHANLIIEHIGELSKDSDPSTGSGQANAYVLGELQRRFSFEFNGMRNHEFYFASLEGTSTSLSTSSPLYKNIEATWGSFDAFLNRFKAIAMTRGIGWAILYYDPHTKQLVTGWTDEQHIGELITCQPILMLDMWEHSFVADYQPSGKKQYVEDFFENLNWSVIENNFESVAK